jgi:hypothetical protein
MSCPYCGGKLKSFGSPLPSGHTHFCQKCGSLHAPYGLEERLCSECGSIATEEDEQGTWYCEDCYVITNPPPSALTLQNDCYAIAKLLFEIMQKHDVQYGTILVEYESETVSFAFEGYNKKFKMEVTKTQIQQRDPEYYRKLFSVLRDRGDAPQ